MGFFDTFRNMLRGNKEFKENENSVVTDLNPNKYEVKVEVQELKLPSLEETPHLTAYVKDRDTGYIDATIVITKDNNLGVAFTALSEPKINKKYGRQLALYRALTGTNIKAPKRRGNYYVKGQEFTNMKNALDAEIAVLSERANKYFRWNEKQ